jgi:hypothetical protein
MERLQSEVFKYFNWDDIDSRKILTDRENISVMPKDGKTMVNMLLHLSQLINKKHMKELNIKPTK